MKSGKRNLVLFMAISTAFTFVVVIFIVSKRNPAQSDHVELPAAATTAWDALLEQIPVAYTTSLPEMTATPLDGTYAKIDQSQPQWWLCLRCADYRPAGGIWKLQFDKGVMRIYYEVTGWKSIASYAVDGDQLIIFNDPYCRDEVGEYTWRTVEGNLELEVNQDTCSFDLRGQNLGQQPWSTCAASQPTPSGCEENLPVPAVPAAADLPVLVSVHSGDSRLYAQPPELYAPANSDDTPPPPGIAVTYHQNSIPYGLNRVVWWQGDWVEATTELSFSNMGVQFFGGPALGWARVLLDGVEVWRGNTSAIGTDGLGHYGGYVNMAGIAPGQHTIRVESLGFDYRPVTVSSFGFSNQEIIEQAGP